MISPGFHSPSGKRKLLPEEQALLDILGWSEADLAYFEAHKATAADIRPGDPVAFFALLGLGPIFWTIAVNLIIGVALTYASTLLAPKQQNGGNPARLETKTSDGQDIVKSDRFAPTAGFDASQNLVELGSVVPVVFANRETINGVTYGGVRVNSNLLWSQLYSLGGSQLIKALFMLGHSGITAIDAAQFAIGDNLLTSYDLNLNSASARLAFYFRSGGGRIRSSDLIAGRTAATDIGNSETAGAPDVFQVRSVNGIYRPDFCFASKPSTQTQFGLYAPIGNDLAYRVNPQVRSISVPQLKAIGDSGDARVHCSNDAQLAAERRKQDEHFSTRSGIVKINGAATTDGQTITVKTGDTIHYHLSSDGDEDESFKVPGEQNSGPDGPDGEAKCEDVAQVVSGLQRTWDDSLVIGERYKIGSCVAIGEQRIPGDTPFVSRVDNEPVGNGRAVEFIFRVQLGGRVRVSSYGQIDKNVTSRAKHRNGSDGCHIFRLAMASGVLDRPAQVIEIGINTRTSIRINGLCNFPNARTYGDADRDSCTRYNGDRIKKGEALTTITTTSNTYTGPETRYSFFRLRFRVAGGGPNAPYSWAPQLFGIRSMTGQPTFNYLRIQFPSAQRWEYTLIPVSAWEIRQNIIAGDLEVLDAKIQSIRTVYGAGCAFEFNGVPIGRSGDNFAIKPTQNRNDIGMWHKDGDSYADAWGKLSELFVFSELSASTEAPEHEIAYVNLIAANTVTPEYSNLSLLGATIRSGPEMTSFQQLSAYVSKGFNSTHLIGSVLRILLTDRSFGLGEVVSPAQVDVASFNAADTWTRNRRYFFDGGISEPFNFRQQGAQWAEYFLHDLLIRGGKFYMQPIAEFDKAHTIGNFYNAGNVSSFEYTLTDSDQRIPPRVSVKWREEKPSSDVGSKGLFPVIREVLVREAGTKDTAPLVSLDLSQFCTSEIHAIDVAKMQCRRTRLITSRVKITTRPDRAAFDPGKLIKAGIESITFPSKRNGVILADGTVQTITTDGTPVPLADGTYTALVWDGTGSSIEEEQLEVIGGKTTAHADAVFSVGSRNLRTDVYKVQAVQFTEEGDVEVEATEFPLDGADQSLLTIGWDDPANWIIEGQIGAGDGTAPLVPTFQSVRIIGPSTAQTPVLSRAAPTVYSSVVSGPPDTYTYAWSVSNGGVVATPAAAETAISWPAPGEYLVTLAATLSGVTQTTTWPVTVLEEVVPRTIGTVSITGPAKPVEGRPAIYTATTTGDATDVVWTWDGDADGILITNNGGTATFTFPTTAIGPETVRVRATSVTAADVSAAATLAVTVIPPPAVGTVMVTGNATPVRAVNAVYTATADGTATDIVWTWSAVNGTATITPNGNTATFNFNTAGTEIVRATATSATSTDSPKSGDLSVTVAALPSDGIVDPQTKTWVQAVEAADTQPLEQVVVDAIVALIDGIKTDYTNLAQFSQMLIMAGPRTMAGALVPFIGRVPTNNGFLPADYSRLEGFNDGGDGKFLATNREFVLSRKLSHHIAVYATRPATGNWYVLATNSLAGGAPLNTGAVGMQIGGNVPADLRGASSRTTGAGGVLVSQTGFSSTPGFRGVQRLNNTSFTVWGSTQSAVVTQAACTDAEFLLTPFVLSADEAGNVGKGSIAFWCCGGGIDLAKLRTRLDTYAVALQVAGIT